ncbi:MULTISPECIES: TetR/AcrR family transcriptional regulator [Gordonibacter]|uniref:TetR/AcrR family transcriptional regulator n=1 Tax=Gordonibacter faecis TaxID=3047475 RepID=A0ABT7DL95_9ACTN|nr:MULTISPECIES: TetR/AcrR family transcriptional regulator [unclassified Gordonibacter]MDJ1650299.1 TetR/AcrR family transcriptional regulator [Gordonibacter sp. KGMB12511]HIW76856.1 TetR/AcrR family transcriptional regulator [Candidatus Gordonibacter avicola]
MDNQYASLGFNTKMKIVEALDDLAQHTSFERVSILQICERADISRSTFYHHFCDKNAVLQWHASVIYEAGIDQIGRTLNWFEGHLLTTRGTERYKNLYYRAGHSTEYASIKPFYVRHRIDTLKETLTEYQNKPLTPLLEFQICATAAAESAMANRRYAGELVLPTKEFCTYMASIVPRELYNALKDPVHPHDDLPPFFLGGVW